jgi:hypothetical protein
MKCRMQSLWCIVQFAINEKVLNRKAGKFRSGLFFRGWENHLIPEESKHRKLKTYFMKKYSLFH